jgi:prepilin-type N-terminal cleavage/methylation domain-containing protein
MKSWIRTAKGALAKADQGFTLIEVAIVLAIVSLLIGMGLQTYSKSLDNAKIKTTGERMDKIEAAITLFAIQNGYLPCPADGSLNTASASFGISQGGGKDTTTACTALTAGTEVVPWRTLGLDELYSKDGWGNRITYYVGGRAQGTTTTDGSINYHNSASTTDGIYRSGTSYPMGTLEVRDISANEMTYSLKTQSNCTVSPNPNGYICAAYVLVSHGAHAAGAYSGNSPAAGSTPRVSVGDASASETENNDGDRLFIQNTPTERASSSGIFDDIVRWRSAPSIVASCGAAACGNS